MKTRLSISVDFDPEHSYLTIEALSKLFAEES